MKSMRGEELTKAFVGFSGIYGDRVYAFVSSDSPEGFPYLTGREKSEMLLYNPRFRNPDKTAKPTNLSEAEKLAPGVTPVYAEHADLDVEIETPSGKTVGINDPVLIQMLSEGLEGEPKLTLSMSHRAMTDCRPVSLISNQTSRQLGEELDVIIDKRRFRANIYMDLATADGFEENSFIGKTLRIGSKAQVAVLERDPRCKMITLDPDTAEQSREVLQKVVKAHDGMAGIYGAVLVEGMVNQGDEIEMLN